MAAASRKIIVASRQPNSAGPSSLTWRIAPSAVQTPQEKELDSQPAAAAVVLLRRGSRGRRSGRDPDVADRLHGRRVSGMGQPVQVFQRPQQVEVVDRL